MANQTSRSRIAVIICICVAIVVALALVIFMVVSTTTNRPIQTVNATQASLPKTADISVQMEGIEGDLISGAIITLIDESGEKILDKIELKKGETLPAVRAGKYDLSVDAPAVGADGGIYEVDRPIREIIVGEDGNIDIDLIFEKIPTDQMTPERLQKIKDELEAAGVPQDIIDTVTDTYTNIPTPTPEVANTETWTYVETPQPQVQPQPQQQPQQSQPQTHAHNWVTKTEKTITGYAEQYATGFHCETCGGGFVSEILYTFKNPHPADEDKYLQEIYAHQAQTGHSGIWRAYSPTYSKQPVYETVTYYVCSDCGVRQG